VLLCHEQEKEVKDLVLVRVRGVLEEKVLVLLKLLMALLKMFLLT
jgi:hypothetical protein